MTEFTYRQAIARGLADALQADDDVFLLGQDVGAAGGALKTTEGLFGRFGPRRVLDTPISEQAIVGTAIGAAVMGLRPIAEIMFADFAAVCFDQIVNELAKYRYMTDGQVSLPVTIRMANGAAGFAAQHGQPAENWFLNVPGLKIVVPGTPADMYGLLRAAIADPDPVLVFEHKGLYNLTGEITDTNADVEIGKAEVARIGTDVTIATTQLMRHHAVDAAAVLARDGIECEVIDMRSLAPLDLETVAASLDKTSALVVAQEAPNAGSWGATLIALLVGEHFDRLDARPLLLGADETPIPYAQSLEAAWMPSVERIIDGVRHALDR